MEHHQLMKGWRLSLNAWRCTPNCLTLCWVEVCKGDICRAEYVCCVRSTMHSYGASKSRLVSSDYPIQSFQCSKDSFASLKAIVIFCGLWFNYFIKSLISDFLLKQILWSVLVPPFALMTCAFSFGHPVPQARFEWESSAWLSETVKLCDNTDVWMATR